MKKARRLIKINRVLYSRMFHTSTQREHWTFSSKDDLFTLRERVNENYRSKMSSRLKLGPSQWLAPDEELKYIKYYEGRLQSFCNHFKVFIACRNLRIFHKFYEGSRQEYFLPSANRQSYFNHLLQAFLLADVCDGIQPAFCRVRMSVARYQSGRIQRFYFRICRELAAKRSRRIDSLRRFNSFPRVAHHPRFEGTSFFFPDFSKSKYHLTIHNPYRPLEGFLIDLRTRCEGLQNSDILRQNAYAFLEKVFRTDVPLLYPPSVIAIAACRQSASENKLSIDQYVIFSLF
jgi:cyclin H